MFKKDYMLDIIVRRKEIIELVKKENSILTLNNVYNIFSDKAFKNSIFMEETTNE